jgi:hypothetical protein
MRIGLSKALVKSGIFLLTLTLLCVMEQRASASAVTYLDAAGNQFIYVAATGTDHHLLVYSFDAFNFDWNWSDQGLPQGTTGVFYPSAITFQDATTGDQTIFIFAMDNNGHVVANRRTDGNWHWTDYGLPPFGIGLHDRIAAVSYPDGAGNQQIFVFATTQTDHLAVLSVVVTDDSFNFGWIDGGHNPGPNTLINPTAITFMDTAAAQHTCAYLDANDLIEACRNPDGTWTLTDRGVPPGATQIETPTAFSYQDDVGAQEIGVFCAGGNGHLELATSQDGSNWSWSDLSPFTQVGYSWPAAVTYFDPSYALQKEYAFINRTDNDHLYVRYWDGFGWRWGDQDIGPNGTLVSDGPKDAITYTDAAGNQWFHTFVMGSNNHLLDSYWDGSYNYPTWYDLTSDTNGPPISGLD